MLDWYATEPVSPAQRVRRWIEYGSQILPGLSVRPYEAAHFRARLMRIAVGGIDITSMCTTPAVAGANDSESTRWADGKAAFLLCLVKRGRLRLKSAGHEVHLRAGDIVLRDLLRQWETDACVNTTLVSIRVPAARFVASIGDPAHLLGVPLRSHELRTSLLASVMDESSRLALESPTQLPSGAFENLLLGAMRIAYDMPSTADASARESCVLAVELNRIIDSRLDDPSFTVAELAAVAGLSMRSLQRLFSQRAQTARSYILGRRLEVAARRLRECRDGNQPNITAIALSCGFNDPSYFSRAFAAHFDMSPRAYLRQEFDDVASVQKLARQS